MEFKEMVVLACSLAMDSFAVSLIFGTRDCLLRRRQALMVALIFALVQGAFITIAWQAGGRLGYLIESVDHWVAFGLLALVAIHMLREGKAKIYAPKPDPGNAAPGDAPPAGPECAEILSKLGAIDTVSLLPASLLTLVGLAVATSIDSLGAGVGVSLVDQVGWAFSLVVFVITFLLSAAGAFLGRRARSVSRMGGWACIVGGLVLLSLGLDILHKHGVI